MKDPKILLWDIEASNLAANFGFIFCIGYKWFGEKKTHLISIRDFKKQFNKDTTDDSKVIEAFSKVMEEADMQVTWYGQKFDEPFVQTRLMLHDMKPLPNIAHLDAWRIARYKLKFNSNRLDTVSKSILHLQKKKETKTSIESTHWIRGAAGYADSLKYIEDHCIADVNVLENVYKRIRVYGTSMPNLAKIKSKHPEGCASCGSFNIQKNGIRPTARGIQQRYRCMNCGHPFQLSK